MATVTGGNDGDLTAPLLDPDFYAGDPFPLYARLRAEAPLARNDALGFWVASRHADVVTVSRDPETFCSGKGIMVFEIGAEYPTSADHDAHRPARPHPLPEPGAAGLPAHASCGPSRTACALARGPWSTASSRVRRWTSWRRWPSRSRSRSSATCWACPRRSGPASSAGPRR